MDSNQKRKSKSRNVLDTEIKRESTRETQEESELKKEIKSFNSLDSQTSDDQEKVKTRDNKSCLTADYVLATSSAKNKTKSSEDVNEQDISKTKISVSSEPTKRPNNRVLEKIKVVRAFKTKNLQETDEQSTLNFENQNGSSEALKSSQTVNNDNIINDNTKLLPRKTKTKTDTSEASERIKIEVVRASSNTGLKNKVDAKNVLQIKTSREAAESLEKKYSKNLDKQENKDIKSQNEASTVSRLDINNKTLNISENTEVLNGPRKSKSCEVSQASFLNKKKSRISRTPTLLENLDTLRNGFFNVMYIRKEKSQEIVETSKKEKQSRQGHDQDSVRLSKEKKLNKKVNKVQLDKHKEKRKSKEVESSIMESNIKIKLDGVGSIEKDADKVKKDKHKEKRKSKDSIMVSNTKINLDGVGSIEKDADKVKKDKHKKKSKNKEANRLSNTDQLKSAASDKKAKKNLKKSKAESVPSTQEFQESSDNLCETYQLESGLRNYKVEEKLKSYTYKFNHEDSLSNFANK